MPSRTSTYSVRMAPPVRPSRSLEGMEKVIPPTMKHPFAPSHSELFLNKPLPAMPLLPDRTEEEPAEGAFWSDSSDDSETESTVDSGGGPSEPRSSTELYPILISSGSNDFVDLVVDHPVPSSTSADHLGPLDHQPAPRFLTPESRADSTDSDTSFILQARSISEVQYGRPAHWPQRTNHGTNHYFREKKWDFFPELADPSSAAAQQNGRGTPSLRNGKSGKKDGRLISLDLSKGRRHRWKSLDSRALGGMRDSIKTYVSRTLSKGSAEDAPRQRPPLPSPLPSPTRPTTAPLGGSRLPKDSSPRQSDDGGELLSNKVFAPEDSGVELRTMSVSTKSSVDSDLVVSPKTDLSPRQKQLAIPQSPYQKYGATVWEKETTKSGKRRSVRFPQYTIKTSSSPPTSHHHRTSVSTTRASLSSRKMSGSSATHHPSALLSPPQRMQHQGNRRGATRTLQDGKSHLLVATKRIIQSKEDRRREQLKAQIKHFGPLGAHGYSTVNQWT
ncbi:hypothetical protein N7510_000544 [Penicillium lagena]|uniref:uncharacterized protein n=1 Tax=Penicillium lagena TaxID=94218 RepID=UPI002541CE49|nr:uncharacterized protein N7510_000544 [Penicillium lagena]KAJ5624235.1 hypothetical protein N7510_000544 [Penicillium lagena]